MIDASWISAVALGLVEGLTEFIPVSSTGHLILFGEWLGFKNASAPTFAIFIQLGAILAVLVLYWPRFVGLLNINSRSTQGGFAGFAGWTKIFAACIPAFIVGFLAHDFIKEQLFGPLPVAFALITWGLVMIMTERFDLASELDDLGRISVRTAFLIGCFQLLSLWPGVSRSGSTIVGGMLLGLRREVAAEFSFIVAVPVMSAAVLYDLWKSWSLLTAADLVPFALGFFVSFITAILAIRFFIRVLNRWTLVPFGYYRVALGVLVVCLIGQ